MAIYDPSPPPAPRTPSPPGSPPAAPLPAPGSSPNPASPAPGGTAPTQFLSPFSRSKPGLLLQLRPLPGELIPRIIHLADLAIPAQPAPGRITPAPLGIFATGRQVSATA